MELHTYTQVQLQLQLATARAARAATPTDTAGPRTGVTLTTAAAASSLVGCNEYVRVSASQVCTDPCCGPGRLVILTVCIPFSRCRHGYHGHHHECR